MNPPTSKVIYGDCVEAMNRMNPESIDAVVTDPPYAIALFRQGDETWDAQAIRQQARSRTGGEMSLGEGFELWCQRWGTSCYRVMRPGAHLLAFGSPRTFHRLVAGIEDAGFEIRDVLMWLYSSGMPKSRRLPRDRATALKPAYEPIVLARRPLDTTAEEAASWGGVGTLDVGSCRVHGRHPANVLFSTGPNAVLVVAAPTARSRRSRPVASSVEPEPVCRLIGCSTARRHRAENATPAASRCPSTSSTCFPGPAADRAASPGPSGTITRP